jgi:hypothetical protein
MNKWHSDTTNHTKIKKLPDQLVIYDFRPYLLFTTDQMFIRTYFRPVHWRHHLHESTKIWLPTVMCNKFLEGHLMIIYQTDLETC